MATQTKKHAGARFIPPRQLNKPSPTPGRRFKQRLLYNLRHPIDAAWGWLSSVRTAILLIASIVIICLLGIYFVQAPGEVLNDPLAYSAWVQQNALPRYGSLTSIFDWLQFFTIFSSWYFLSLLTILSLSLIVCTLNRAPTIWQNFKHPVIQRSDKFYQNALERSAFSHPDPVTWTTAQLRQRHYRVRSVVIVRAGAVDDAGRGPLRSPWGDSVLDDRSVRAEVADDAGRRPLRDSVLDSRPTRDNAAAALSASRSPWGDSVLDSRSGSPEVQDPGSPSGDHAIQEEKVTYLYANKNSWATLATFVFHAALVTLLMAGVLSQWHGFPINSPARNWLPAPLVSFSDNLAGFTFDQALPDGQSAVVYPRGTPHNISFRANSFTATFDPRTGLPTDYVTDLSVYQDGVLVAHSNHLRVNDPLSYNGIVFHQSSLIPSITLTVADAQGCIVCAQPIVLDQTAQLQQGLVVDYANGIPVAGTPMTISVLFPHNAGTQLAQVQNPFFLISIGTPGTPPNQDKAVVRLHTGERGYSVDKQWTITVNNAQEATVLLVTKDSGSFLVWPTAVLLILSLCLTFYFPQRRIWLRVEGEHVQMAALREHFTSIRTDLLGISRQATQLI